MKISSTTISTTSKKHNIILPYLIICLLSGFAYYKSLAFGFSYLDDNTLIIDNSYFMLKLSNIINAFKTNVFLSSTDAYYRPMLTVSLIIDSVIGKLSPFVFHFTNVLIHTTTSCLVYYLLAIIGFESAICIVLSAIFAIHPAISQAVAWIPGRNDSLLALFSLVSFISLVKHFKTDRNRYFVLCFVFFLAAIFTKESAIFMPLLGILYGLFVVRKTKISSYIMTIIFYLICAALFFHYRNLAFKNPIPFTIQQGILTIWNEFPSIFVYIGKFFFPTNLSILTDKLDAQYSPGIYGTAFLLLAIFFSGKKKNLAVFGILWYLVFLLPGFIHFDPKSYYLMEHRAYLPSIGFLIVIASFISEIKNGKIQKLTKYFLYFTVGIFTVFTYNRVDVFKNRIAFWESAIKSSPHSALSHRNLGAIYYLDNRFEEALREFNKSLELNPFEPMCHNNIGLIYMNRGMFKQSEEEYLKEIKINPLYDNVYYNLGLLYYYNKNITKAKQCWEKAIEINPNYIGAYEPLAMACVQTNDMHKAKNLIETLYKKGSSINPELLKAINDR